MQPPSHIADSLEDGSRQPQGPLEQAYLAGLDGGPVSNDLAYTHDIRNDDYKREVLEAFLLAGADAATVEKVLRVPAKVVEMYKHLFFDASVFRDELDVIAYAQTYAGNDFGRDLKISATTLGLEFLIFRYSKAAPQLDVAQALHSIIESSYMLTKAVRLNKMDSDMAREARQWATVSIKAIESYTRVQPAMQNTDNEFQLALESIERVTTEEKSKINKDEIVH